MKKNTYSLEYCAVHGKITVAVNSTCRILTNKKFDDLEHDVKLQLKYILINFSPDFIKIKKPEELGFV